MLSTLSDLCAKIAHQLRHAQALKNAAKRAQEDAAKQILDEQIEQCRSDIQAKEGRLDEQRKAQAKLQKSADKKGANLQKFEAICDSEDEDEKAMLTIKQKQLADAVGALQTAFVFAAGVFECVRLVRVLGVFVLRILTAILRFFAFRQLSTQTLERALHELRESLRELVKVLPVTPVKCFLPHLIAHTLVSHENFECVVEEWPA